MKLGVIGRLFGPALAGVLTIAGATAWSSPGQAEVIDALFGLRLDGMSTGTCAGMICPEAFGYVSVVGNTDSSLTYTVSLAPGVSFQHPSGPAGATDPILYFDLTGGESGVFRHHARRRDQLHV